MKHQRKKDLLMLATKLMKKSLIIIMLKNIGEKKIQNWLIDQK